MATKTFYPLTNTAVTPNWFGVMQEGGTAPTAANSAYGWTVAKGATSAAFWRGRYGATASVASGNGLASSWIASNGPTKGTGSGATTAGDSFISPSAYTGTFASGAWTISLVMRTLAATIVGRMRMRVWASQNADGTSARELTSGAVVGSTITMSATATNYTSTLTWSPSAITLLNEYLFFQMEWETTTAGTSNSCAVIFRVGSALITTTNFVQGYVITAAVASPPYVLVGTSVALNKPGLPQIIAGISTSVSCCGPFALERISYHSMPNFILGQSYQDFGRPGFITEVGGRFIGTGDSITNVRVQMGANGTMTDNVVCKIYATTGGTGLPTGASLGTSTAIAGPSLDTAFNGEWENFTFPTPVATTAGTEYAFVLSRTGTLDDTNKPSMYGTSSPTGSSFKEMLYYNAGTPGWTSTNLSPAFQVTFNGSNKYYFFGVDSATPTTLVAMKSNNPYNGWSSVASVSSGFTTAILQIRGCMVDGQTIHLAIMDGTMATSVAVKYLSFSMATETFHLSSPETIMAAANIAGTSGATWNCDITVRYDAMRVFAYNGPQISTRAVVYFRTRDQFTALGTQTTINTTGTNNATKIAVGLGWADAVNFCWSESGTNKFFVKWWDWDFNPSTAASTTTLADAWGGVEHSKEPFQGNFLVAAGDYSAQWTEASPPVISTESNASCNNTRRIFWDDINPDIGGDLTLYYVYVDSSTNDIFMYSSTDYGATLSSSTGAAIFTTNITTLPNNISIDGVAYDNGRGNVVLPLIYNDAGVLKYNEYNIRSTRVVRGLAGSYNLIGTTTAALKLPRLPAEVTGLFSMWAAPCGPYLASNGTYYAVGVYNADNWYLVAAKAADPRTDWGDFGTAQLVQTGAAVYDVSCFRDGDVLHIAAQTNHVSLCYITFNMATETWGTMESVHANFDPTSSTSVLNIISSIVVRSDGSVIIAYQGPRASTFSRVGYKIRAAGGGWGSYTELSAAGSVNYTDPEVILGASDRVHFMHRDLTIINPMQRTLPSGGSLSAAVGPYGSFMQYGWNPQYVRYDSAGTIKIFAVGWDSNRALGGLYFDSGATPTFNSTTPVLTSTLDSPTRAFVDGTDIYVIYNQTPALDLYVTKSTNHGSTFSSSPTLTYNSAAGLLQEQRGTWVLSQNGEVYIRGSNYVIPYFVQDVGQTKLYYNEYIVRAFSNNKILTADVPSSAYAVVPGVTANLTQVLKRGKPMVGMNRRFWMRRINR